MKKIKSLNELIDNHGFERNYSDRIVDLTKERNSKGEKHVTLSCKVHESQAYKFKKICTDVLHLKSPNQLFQALVYDIIKKYGNLIYNKEDRSTKEEVKKW